MSKQCMFRCGQLYIRSLTVANDEITVLVLTTQINDAQKFNIHEIDYMYLRHTLNVERIMIKKEDDGE